MIGDLIDGYNISVDEWWFVCNKCGFKTGADISSFTGKITLKNGESSRRDIGQLSIIEKIRR